MPEAPMTREEMAELHGVWPGTIDMWTAQGMPTVDGIVTAGRDRATSGAPRDWRISRRDFAAMIGCHPDTLTKKLGEGLAAAVVEPGGRGAEMIFDLRLAFRWWLADQSQLNRVVLDDFKACARAGVLALAQMPITGMLLNTQAGEPAAAGEKRRQGRRKAAV